MKRVARLLSIFLLVCCVAAFFSACAEDGYELKVQGYKEFLIERLNGHYAAGEKVTVKTEMLHDAVITVYLDGESLGEAKEVMKNGVSHHWEYYFVMPDHDAVLRIETHNGFLG